MINKKVIEHLNRHNLLSDNRYGFNPARSTTHVLSVITHRIGEALDNKFIMSAITVDI